MKIEYLISKNVLFFFMKIAWIIELQDKDLKWRNITWNAVNFIFKEIITILLWYAVYKII